jgi:two-component system, OmpR family, sensor histidine kinase KdpD
MARGRLRIYLGAAPGVGKTYEMLLEGHRRLAQGADCVVALVEPHARRATAALLEGLEVIPRRTIAYRGTEQTEMDLDAVLARRPQVALVDEFAHSNVPGSKNEKRWQDVEDLLENGIDVISTLNVQHLESLSDVFAEVTGTPQRETVPDAVVRKADEMELVDLSPDALRRRIVAGEIYPAARVDQALSHFFRPGNLSALRELALLWLANRVDEGLQEYRSAHGIAGAWEARERIVVAVSGGPESDGLIRRAARLAARMPGSDLMAVHVTVSDGGPGADAVALDRCRALVESLGGSWHDVVGNNVTAALGQFAHHENATQLVVGRSRRNGVLAWLGGTERVAQRVSRLGDTLDVHVVADERRAGRIALRPPPLGISRRRRLRALAMLAVLLPLVTLGLTALRSHLGLADDFLVYLLAVVGAALVGGWYPAILAALVSAILADYFFTTPYHSLDVATASELTALLIYAATAVLVSGVVERGARREVQAARSVAEAAALTSMAEAVLRGERDLPRLVELVRETFGLEALSLLERAGGTREEAGWFVLAAAGDRPPERPEEASVETRIDDTLVLAGRGRALSPPDRQIFSACAVEIATSVRTRRLVDEAAAAERAAGGERQRGELAAAVARMLSDTVAGARGAIDELRTVEPPSEQRAKDLLDAIEELVNRMYVLVLQLNDVARTRAGALDLHLRPVDVREVVVAALDELGPGRSGLLVQLPDGLPNVIADAAVLMRVLIGLAANALRRSPAGTRPVLAASASGDRFEITVEDKGPSRSGTAQAPEGEAHLPPIRRASYGLFTVEVARDLVAAMGGELRAEEPDGGGLQVTVLLGSAAPQPAADGGGAPATERR